MQAIPRLATALFALPVTIASASRKLRRMLWFGTTVFLFMGVLTSEMNAQTVTLRCVSLNDFPDKGGGIFVRINYTAKTFGYTLIHGDGTIGEWHYTDITAAFTNEQIVAEWRAASTVRATLDRYSGVIRIEDITGTSMFRPCEPHNLPPRGPRKF